MKEIAFSYFSGDISPEDSRALREFLSGGESNRKLFRQWEKEWKTDHIPTFHQVMSYKKLSRRIASRKVFRASLGISVAAAVVAVVMLCMDTHDSYAPQPNVFSVETRSCEQTKVVLPDSTTVWLNASSRLSYSDSYMTDDRTVFLEGEGFFDVRHNPNRPFVVKMGDNEITVHGTRFNACAYPEEDVVEAALLEGSISFSNESVKVQMQPGELLSYNKSNEKLLKYTGDVVGRTSWLDGSLVYSSIDIAALLDRISSVYGERIVYNPENLPVNTFSIILNIKESIPNILDAVACICPISWARGEAGEYIVKTL